MFIRERRPRTYTPAASIGKKLVLPVPTMPPAVEKHLSSIFINCGLKERYNSK